MKPFLKFNLLFKLNLHHTKRIHFTTWRNKQKNSWGYIYAWICFATIKGKSQYCWYHCKRNDCVLAKAQQRKPTQDESLFKLFELYHIEICDKAYEIAQLTDWTTLKIGEGEGSCLILEM